MDRTQLLQHFETLAETPESPAKLRQLILSLAVRGRIVTQDSQDEPAQQFIKRIRIEKAAIAEQRELRRAKAQLPLEPAEIEFPVPAGWIWVRLCEVQIFTNGYAFQSSDYKSEGVGIIRMSELGKGGALEESGIKRVDIRFLEELPEQFQVKPGDLLMGMSGSIGKLAFNRSQNIYLLNQRVGRLDPILVEKQYLYYFLRTIEQRYLEISFGMAIKNLSTEQINETPFPLPPLAEQRRIVAKVEELLALCAELEARQTAAREHRTRLVRSALDHLTTGVRPSPVAATSARTRASENSNAGRPHHAAAPEDGRTPDDFRRHAAFILQEFQQITNAPEDIPALRQAILSLAVQGKLVPQDPDEKPAFKQNEIDIRSEYPPNWSSGTVFDLAALKSGNSFAREMELEEGDYLYVKVSDMNLPENQHEITTSSRFVTPEQSDLKNLIPAGSIIFPKRGGAIATNKKRLVRTPLFVDPNTMAMICPTFIELRYLHIWFLGIDLWELNSGTSVPQINNKDIGPLIVPVPPLAEQQRIVAKVDELMRWCDALEARLTAVQTTAAHLLDATLHQILARSFKGGL